MYDIKKDKFTVVDKKSKSDISTHIRKVFKISDNSVLAVNDNGLTYVIEIPEKKSLDIREQSPICVISNR